MTARPDGVPVDGTRDPHRYEDLAQMSEMIDAEIAELLRVKREIKTAVRRVGNPVLRTVLEKRYVECKPWDLIADEMHYSRSRVTQLHGAALCEAEKTLKRKL